MSYDVLRTRTPKRRQPWPDFHKETGAWLYRLRKNGYSLPSRNNIRAVDLMLRRFDSIGILYKFATFNLFLPDDLSIALSPQICRFGYETWTNYNFTASDLSVNGLVGNGSNKYLNTGVNGRSALSATSNGMSVYIYDTVGQQAFDMGCDGSDSGYLELTSNWYDGSLAPDTANVYCDESYDTQQAVSYFTPNTSFYGYHSGNRTASNAIDIYFANSSVNHVAHPSTANHTGYGATAAKTANLPNVNITCFCTARYTGTSPGWYSSKRFSMAAIHYGMTAAESAECFAAVHLCRQRIGGGWR